MAKKSLDQILEKIHSAPENQEIENQEIDMSPTFEEQKERIKNALSSELSRFHLKIQTVALDGEYVIYQGSIMNVWGRISKRRTAFYRVVLERQLIKLGLIEPGPDQILHRV